MNENIPSKAQLYEEYWGERMPSIQELSEKYDVCAATIYSWMDKYQIPRRKDLINKSGVVRWMDQSKSDGHAVWKIKVDGETFLESRWIVENELKIKIKDNEVVHHRDGNPLNNHPFNLLVLDKKLHASYHAASARGEKVDGFDDCPWFWNHMIFAYSVADNSHCRRLKVGAVITNYDMDAMYAFGYNGNARHLANDCDSSEAGKCGCIHAEANALLKVRCDDKHKILFVTHSPCVNCTKLIINAGFKYVFYGETYRDSGPLKLLNYSGVRTCPYPIEIKEHSGGRVYLKKPSTKPVCKKQESVACDCGKC